MSFFNIFAPITSAFSGLINFGSDISSGITNVTHSVTYGLGELVNFIQSIPGDVMTALQNLGFAIWHALQSVGGFLYAGFHDIASAVIGGLNEIRKGFTYIGESLVNFGNALRQDLINLAGTVVQAFTIVGQLFVDVWNDLKKIGEVIWNVLITVWNGLVAFGNDVVNSIIGAFNLVGQVTNIPSLVSDIPSLVTGLTKQEASRVAGAFPRVVGFNVAMETMKGKTKKGNLSFMDAFLLPIKSAILGTVTEAIMQSFYPEISKVQQYVYNTSKTPPAISTPSVSQTNNQPLPSQVFGQTSLSGTPTTPTPTQFETTPPTVIGVGIEEQLCMGQSITCTTISGSIASNVGGYNVGEWILTFSDTFGISANVLLQLLRTQGVLVEDEISPTIEASTQLQGFTPSDQVTLSMTTSVNIASLPPPLQFCTSSYQPASTVVSDETATDELSVYVEYCVPIYTMAIDNFSVNGAVSSITAGFISLSATGSASVTGVTD